MNGETYRIAGTIGTTVDKYNDGICSTQEAYNKIKALVQSHEDIATVSNVIEEMTDDDIMGLMNLFLDKTWSDRD